MWRERKSTHTNLFVFSFLIQYSFILSSSEVFYYPSMLSGVDLLVTNGGFLHRENHTQTCTHTRSLEDDLLRVFEVLFFIALTLTQITAMCNVYQWQQWDQSHIFNQLSKITNPTKDGIFGRVFLHYDRNFLLKMTYLNNLSQKV